MPATLKLQKLNLEKGSPHPFGATRTVSGMNFSVFSKCAKAIKLLLEIEEKRIEIPFLPSENKTGDVWHIHIEGLPSFFKYAYQIESESDTCVRGCVSPLHPLLDPYASSLDSGASWGDGINSKKGIFAFPPSLASYDWEGEKRPNIPFKELIIYEMHLRGFTAHISSNCENPGTFEGAIKKLDHLQEMGINAIELLPIQEFDECKGPVGKEHLKNYWGYSPVNFFAPMRRYSAKGNLPYGPLDSFREFVKACHSRGMEVILDVVFNHTSEGNEYGPIQSFKGFDNSIYYMMAPDGTYFNFSGCGNTLNCNHPLVRELIHDCLRQWVVETHVDGFRFDLASILGRASDGSPLASPPLIEQIALDPILTGTKLIAEAWDAGGLYQVGSFPSWNIWAEWNGKYRDTVRAFIKGTDHTLGDFAKRLSGSQDLYDHGRSPCHSINFLISHDGFTLRDLVSYNCKHNEVNGEENRDGANDNQSWNCGEEGVSRSKEVLELRKRQMKNLHLALMVSVGVPMVHMGDEYGHTKQGNNNTWCQDNELNWLNWEMLKKEKDFFNFYKNMILFRKNHPLFSRHEFLTEEDIQWRDEKGDAINWSRENRFLAYILKDAENGNDLFIAFNANWKEKKVTLPSDSWALVVDTSKDDGESFLVKGKKIPFNSYLMPPYSSLILKKAN